MDTYDLNIAELNDLTTLLLNPNFDNDDAIEAVIALSPTHFLTLAANHPTLQDPFYIQKSLEEMLHNTDKQDFFRHSFFRRFADGDFDSLLKPYFQNQEGQRLHNRFLELAEHYAGTMIHLYTITGGSNKELNLEKISKHLETLSTLDLNKNAPISKRYLKFLTQMNESVALLELMLEEDADAFAKVPKHLKVQAASATIIKDIESLLEDKEPSAHSFLQTLIKHEDDAKDMLQGALNLAYSLSIENAREHAREHEMDGDLICDAIANKADDIVNAYQDLYDMALHPPVYQENSWQKLMKPRPAQKMHVAGSGSIKPKSDPSPTRTVTK